MKFEKYSKTKEAYYAKGDKLTASMLKKEYKKVDLQ